MKKDCAFQYYDGSSMIADETGITLDHAKKLFNRWYYDMVSRVKDDSDITVALWINMEHESDYHETLIYLESPEIKHGKLCEIKYQYFNKFKID